MRSRFVTLALLVTVVTAASLERPDDVGAQFAQLREELAHVRKELHEHKIKRAELERVDLSHILRKHEARIDKLDAEVQRLRYENRQLKGNISEATAKITAVTQEVRTKMMDETNKILSYNDIEQPDVPRSHRIRHAKMIHTQISRLAKGQQEADGTIRRLEADISDVQRRVDNLEEPNWNLMSTKVELLELENNVLKDQVRNLTEKSVDVNKLHASVLELREDLENIENKSDKTMPEVRKEISKLDVCMAQLTAQASYLKEDQENLRQSVKAIAVSVSNTMDRAELDRHALTELNDSVLELRKSSKQHFHRLNDHIRKSEANHVNETLMPLPELMGQVMDLEPMKEHYEALISELPSDCSAVDGPPSSYLINTGHHPTETWCQNKETLLQRRYNGTVDFNRKMKAYANGFGNPEGEFWIGLDNMHRLTADNCSGMRIEMTDIYDKRWFAEYDHFSVGDAAGGYELHVSGFRGNASDAFAFHDQMKFSTMDVDRDVSKSHCALNYEGGWWYSHCQHVNINGKYTLGLTWFDVKRNEWIAVASSEMRLYRRDHC